MKGLLMMLVLALFSTLCFTDDAEAGKKNISIVPVLLYDHVSLDNQQFHTSGEGLVFTKENLSPSFGEEQSFIHGDGKAVFFHVRKCAGLC
jgi:hypothetical protein